MRLSARTKSAALYRRQPVIILLLLILLEILKPTSAFSDSFYFEVKENSPAQTYVGKIATKPGFTYRFNDDPVEFDLNPETGIILTTDVAVDRESRDLYNLVILSSSPTYPIEVKIRVLDVNDNVPSWPSSINTNISFSESAPVGTKVIIDNAIDLDSGQLTYRIEPVSEALNEPGLNDALPFKLNYNSSTSFLHLEVSAKLDRELQSNYLVNITAIDDNDQSSVAIFNIRILDSNDNPPIFDHSDYSVSLNESMPKDVSILQVRATDADEEDNENSRISYFLNSEDFRIDPKTGVISTAHDGPIICGTTTEKSANECWRICVFTVFAHDYGVPRQDGRTYVTAKIYDSNNHAPSIKFRYFSKSQFANVDESAASGSVVAAVSVVDFDHGRNGQISVELTGGNELGHFRLDSVGNSHILKVNANLDRQKVPQYNLTVLAYDHGTPRRSTTANLLIFVQDQNHTPTFEKEVYEATISETQYQVGLFVCALRAVDLDEGINAQIYYSLSGANSHYFKIDPYTGLVTTDKVINREEIDFFDLKVTATDGGSNPKWAQASLRVKVLDINDEVPTLELLSAHSASNQTASYVVELQEGLYLELDVVAKDNDAGNNGTVDVQILYDYGNLFRVETGDSANTVKLVSTQQLHYKHCSSYKIVLLAKDQAPAGHELSSLTTIHVVVNRDDGEEALPTCPHHYFTAPFDQVTVREDVPAMYAVYRMLPADQLGNNQSTFELSLLENPQDLFVIDGNELKLSRTINTAVRLSKKPISAILRVKIRATDKTAATVVSGAQLGEPRCHCSNELTLFISINSSDSRSKARFMKSFYEFFISESTPINEQVFKLAARHIYDDSVSFAIVSGNVNNSFGILPSGFFYIRNRLDRESIDLFLLNVVLHESPRSAARNASIIALDTCQVLVKLRDVNDCRPTFDNSSYRFAVPENAPKNFLIGRVTATDRDIEANSRIVYSVVKSYYSSFVQIDPESGYMWTSVEYDRESLPFFEITVLATDQPVDEDKLSSQVTVRVEILDTNDNAPYFEVPANVSLTSSVNDELLSGKLFVSESVSVGSIVANFQAFDVDFETVITYRLEDAEDTATFELNLSGALTVAKPLDREVKDNYRLTIEASDDKHISRFELQILLEDVNDCQPVWVNLTQTELSIPENISIGSEILHLQAEDPDLGVNGLFHFAIENQSGSQKVFDVLGSKLVVVNHLDYEKNKAHLLNVSLIESHSGRVASTKSIRILIEDVNDNAPYFVQRADTEVVRVLENIDIGTKLLTLQAIDYDQSDVLTYEIVRCNTHYHTHNIHDSNNCPLSLNTKTGEIININNLDREVIESVNLQLSVSDNTHSDKMKVIFIIEDVNDETPYFVSPKKILVSKETISRPNALIGSVKAIDLDMGTNSAITYSLESTKFEEYIELDRYLGSFKVKRSLEHLANRELQMNVTATDGGGLSTTDTVQLIVRPDLPYLQTEPVNIDIYENGPIGAQVAKLQCDQSVFPCQFHLVNATDRNFQVDTWSGVITTVDLIDREALAERLLEVLVVSKSNLQHVRVSINVLDENDNPPYLTNTSIAVHLSESVQQGTQVFDLSQLIADEDTNNKFDYQIINCSQCDGTFALNRKTGVLTLQSPLDCEKISKYRILFGVSDGIYLLTSIMDIIVDDENDNKPYFNQSLYVFSIEENTERGVVVGQVTAFDDDVSNKNLDYSVLSGTSELDAVLSVFSLDSRSGQITLSKRLDYEVDQSEYAFFVQASDGKYKSSPVKVFFKLINLPDNPPIFESSVYKFEVMENTLSDHAICVKASDADLRRIDEVNTIDGVDDDTNNTHRQMPLKYNIDTLSSVKDCFSIDSSSGCIYIVKPLDRESLAQINLTVIADDGFFNATTLVMVKLLDDNDNYPIFDQSTPSVLHIEENAPLDAVVYTFKATDRDEPPNSYIKYEIVANETAASSGELPFVIGPIDGQLKVTGSIDREKVDHFDVIIRATDYGLKYSEINCRIEVDDVIDNAPFFSKPFFELSLYENTSVGEYVFQLDAKDADETDEINYKIISGNALGHFKIDDEFLTVFSKLNYEEISEYNLKINAIDKAGNLDTVNVKVNVLNVMDEKPVFVDSPFAVSWFENQVGVVGRYEALPDDTIPLDGEPTLLSYGHINYLLVNNYENSFRLNSSTGVLSVVKAIDREALTRTNAGATIELKLIAIDTRSRLSSEGLVLVKVVDTNDNEPYFESAAYTFHLNENQAYGYNSTVGLVAALDLDEADALQYELLADSLSIFAIDEKGRIYTTASQVFDREKRDMYHLTVRVSDSKHLASVPVKVVIDDVNDCSPRLRKLNHAVLPKNSETFKLKLSLNQFNSAVEKKFPLIGLQVSDCDSGANGQVQLRMNNDALYNVLSVDQRHGLIRCDYKNSHLLRDTLAKVPSIGITITDNSPLNQLSTSFSIIVELNSNSNSHQERTLLKDSFVELSVSELSRVNATLHRFELLQAVSEIDIYAGDLYGHFAMRDNHLVLSRPLDYESTKSFDLFVQAINHQKDHDEFQYVFVRVNVVNENDNEPRFLHNLYNASILEEEDETFVVQVMATDLDSDNSRIKYKLLNGDKVPFRIDSDSGSIWTVAKIDRELTASYRLTVAAEDEGGLSSSCIVEVRILDRNDNPVKFTRLFRANITENTPIGSFVIQVTSLDRDERGNSNVTYDLLTKTGAFEIDRVTGNVYVAAELDREKRDEYMLTVSADDGSWKAQTTLTIYILDENDVTPSFELPAYRFDTFVQLETSAAPRNVTIGQVRAVDSDEAMNGLVSYRLKSHSKYFTVDAHSGQITLKKWSKVYADMHFLNQHFLTVVASDKGLLPRTSEVPVLVRCFAEQQSRLGAELDTVVLTVPVDLANQTLLYTASSLIFVLDHQGQEQKQLVRSKYNQLFFSGQSKLQANKSYKIKVDNGFGVIEIHLKVTDANLFAPVFTGEHNSTTVQESFLEQHQLVERFNVIDQDQSAANNVVRYQFNITGLHWNANSTNYLAINYRDKYPHLFKRNLTPAEIVSNIAELAPVLSPFLMNQSTGELQLTHSLDFELITRYSLLVLAADNAWYSRVASLNFDVLVGDIDDFVDYRPKSLRTDPTRPDPMSIGVILVVFFFLVLIIVISTSFLFYHSQQKKNHLREVSIPQRKLFLNAFTPYLSSNSQLPAAAPSQAQSGAPAHASRFATGRAAPVQAPVQVGGTVTRSAVPYGSAVSMCAPMPSTSQQTSMHHAPNMLPIPGQYRADLNGQRTAHHSPVISRMPMKRPDIAPVGPSSVIASNHSVTNVSESASVIASRIQNGASSIYTHTNSENYTDNYSNILAGAEHYDLENASSIAPSDIDIVYHYKGFRNRDTLSAANQKHAPLSRLSPSVSELSSLVPRILTLQDLSPQVPPCPPIMNRSQMRKQVMANPMAHGLNSSANGGDDDVAVTENSFTNCSEFGENYDLCKKDKNMFQRVW